VPTNCSSLTFPFVFSFEFPIDVIKKYIRNDDGKVSDGNGLWICKDYNSDVNIDYTGSYKLEIFGDILQQMQKLFKSPEIKGYIKFSVL